MSGRDAATPAWLGLVPGAVLTALFAGGLLAAAWQYTRVGLRQTAPSLGWRMDFLHVTMLILFVTLGLWALMRIFEMLTGRHDGRAIPISEDL